MSAWAIATPTLVHFSTPDSFDSNFDPSRLLIICEADIIKFAGDADEDNDDELAVTIPDPGGGGGDDEFVEWLWVNVPVGFDVRWGSVSTAAVPPPAPTDEEIGAEHIALSSFRIPSSIRISRSILLLSSSFFI